MKKIFIILIVFILTSCLVQAQKVCCPVFEFGVGSMMPCEEQLRGETTTPVPVKDSPVTQEKCSYNACKHTATDYYVSPKKIGYTYNWQITGGTPATATGNQVNITWGNGTEGKITIYIKNLDGSCRDTITETFCLQDAPTANFSFTPPSPVCLNQLIQFNNTSIGAKTYYWDFGDGSSSTLVNPSHNYTTPGTYTITLAVSNGYVPKNPIYNGGPEQIPQMECGCRDTIRKTITVKAESGITIIPGCKQMLCKGDTASYCTSNNCNGYNWSVTGGRILGAANGKCINVVWDGSYPATVTLSGNCGGTCGNSGTIQVPVLYPSMPIQGNNKVCPNSFYSYSLPSMPGTFYKWKITGTGNMIVGPDSNTSVINVQWGNNTGSYTITCHYNNPSTGCSGDASITVEILPPFKIFGPTNFCVGQPFSYTANGPGVWTIKQAPGFTPLTFANGVTINGVWNKPGTYTVTATPVTPSNFCSYPDSKVVIVLDTPKLNNVTGPVLICPNGTAMYAISSNMNAGYYSWSATGGSVLSNMGSHNDSVMVKWNATGPYMVQVFQTVEGCTSSSKYLKANPHTPPLITGVLSTCMDVTLTYTASGTAPVGGFNWTLSNGLGTIISGQGTNSIQVLWHGTTTALDSCAVTVTTCAGTDSKTVKVIAPKPMVITYTGSLCSNTVATLSLSLAGSGTYIWKRNGVTLAPPQNTQSINITQAGHYTVTVDNNPCANTASIDVPEEKLNITANISTLDKTVWGCNETIHTTLNAIPGTGGYCYQWYYSGIDNFTLSNPLSGANTSHYTAVASGYYWCKISICNSSCVAITNSIHIWKWGCPTIGSCQPHTVNFTFTPCNAFTFTPTANPPAALASGDVTWYFGDGDTSHNLIPTHNYRDTGAYSVCFINWATNPYCTKDTCKTVQVNIAANFSAKVNCDKVTFTNLSKARLPITSFNWTFAGGAPASSSLQNPPDIIFAAAGPHVVTLTVTDGVCTTTLKDTVWTTSVAATMNVPTPICAKTEAPFTATVTDPNLHYTWNFGDGFISHLDSVSHAYQNSGPYTVTLTVYDNAGCSKTYTQQVNVLPAINVNIGGDKQLCPGGTVTLTAPAGYANYQWFKDGAIVQNGPSVSYIANAQGEYWVTVSNGNGCVASSNHINVIYSSLPRAIIKSDRTICTNDNFFTVYNNTYNGNYNLTWTGTGPATINFNTNNSSPSNVNITPKTPGDYQIILNVEDKTTHCKSADTICITLVQSPTVTVTGPTGQLCEGKIYTFTATASPNISPDTYSYLWNNGATGNVLSTGKPGVYMVYAGNPSGCSASAFAGTIRQRPDVSLFPVGCDTLCWTDTLRFPLPYPSPSGAYTITWFDDDGTAVTNVGNSYMLPLSTLQPGIHHLHATVSFAGGCADTTGIFDLYIKDCTLLPVCDNCTGLVESISVETNNEITSAGNFQLNSSSITFTILKPVKEVRISLADLKYYWKDTSCNNCKIQMIERGCLFPAAAGQALGTLLLDSAGAVPPGVPNNKCPDELVWKNGTMLQPGTYTVPVQLSLPKPTKDRCILVLDKLCFHVTITDTTCKSCDKIVCRDTNADNSLCKCNAANVWTSLYLLPKKPGIPKPRNLVLCNSTLVGYEANTDYVLSGVFHCIGNCASTKNEITVYNQVNQIIYTHVATTLNETISFPANGMYSISLAAWCGTKKCVCSFKIVVFPEPKEPPIVIVPGGNPTGNPTGSSLPGKIDSVLSEIIPKDFNGQILVSRNDTTLYEKYISYKDSVNSHTAFDLASVTKTFTSMAILKMMEEGKLNLDDAVVKYLPEFNIPEITIRMLLSHRSGLEDYLKFIDESDWDKRKNLTNNDLLQFISKNKSKVLINPPGKVFDYSNTNFALLSLIIEKISGQLYKDYLSNTFFRPLQMNDTYVLGLDNFARATKSYYKNGKEYTLRYLDLVTGDKCVFSTVQDLKKWDKALRSGNLFKPSTLALAFAPTSPLTPFVSNYGLGWKKLVTADGKEIIYHTGWWAGSRSILIRLVKENTMIAVVSNNNFTNIADIRKLCDLFGNYQQSNKTVSNF